MKIWRRLVRAGAVQLKGAVYVLPHSEDHYEFCQWLMAEVATLGGDGDFVITDTFEMLGNSDIIALFRSQRGADYKSLEKKRGELEVKLSSVEKGSTGTNSEDLRVHLDRLLKEYSDIRSIDFFPFRESREAGKKISSLQRKMAEVLGRSGAGEIDRKKPSIPRRIIADYKGKVWVTRNSPFVDRMASAWFIRRFIDRDGTFRFLDEQEGGKAHRDAVYFDMKEGDITHVGDLCTFEVLVKSFGIKDKAVRTIAALVHELDMKDEKYSSPEARGIGEILLGIRKTGKDDHDILSRGMDVFEMLYASKT